jgi:hypothetical protein
MYHLEDKPKMINWLLPILLAALLASLAYSLRNNRDFQWLMLLFGFLAVALALVFVIAFCDYLAYRLSLRMYDLREAKVRPAVELATAIKGLTTDQLEMVARHDLTALEMMVTDKEPQFLVRCPGGSVPWHFVDEFLNRSVMTEPYLFPERDMGNKEWAMRITNLIIIRQWATKGTGPFSARLKDGVTLKYVASKFGVELTGIKDLNAEG